MRTSTTLLAPIICVLFTCTSATVNAGWTKYANNGGDMSTAVASDNNGNVIVTGYFTSDINMGTQLITMGGKDIFIYKFDPNGNFIWGRRAGSVENDEAHSICTDAAGNIYIAGSVEDGADFGSFTTSVSGGTSDAFIAKYDPNGNCVWVTTDGGNELDEAMDIEIDNSGDLFITGRYWDYTQIGNQSLSAVGEYDLFVAKYNNSGTFQWAMSAGGPDAEFSEGIALYGGDIYITGYYHGAMEFGSTVLQNEGGTDIFVAKLNSSGVPQWAHSGGGLNIDKAHDIAIDGNGLVYVSGYFVGNATFDQFFLQAVSGEQFLAVYDQGGNCSSVVHYSGSEGYGVCADQIVGVRLTMNYGYQHYSTDVCFDKSNLNNTYYTGVEYFTVGGTKVYVQKVNGTTSSVAELNSLVTTICPNPATDFATIAFARATSGILTVRNILGQSIAETEVENALSQKIDFSNFCPGIYTVTLQTPTGTSVIGKIIH